MTYDLKSLVEAARGHVEADEPYNAAAFYRLVLRDTSPPTTGVARVAHGEACLWYAREALSRGKLGTAADWYREAVSSDPLAVNYRVELAIKCLLPMGMLKDARLEALAATKIDPNEPEAWHALGGIEHELGNADACIAAYDRQLELAPDDPDALLDRAHIALDVEDYDRVRGLCASVQNTRRVGDAYHCLGMVAHREGRHEDAIALYHHAIDLGCRHADLVRWNCSLSLHAIGRYKEGWAEHEARGRQTVAAAMARAMNRFSLPLWTGEPSPARLHVHQEQGHGDTLALARYVPLLVERGYDVTLEVADSLVGLLARSFPAVNVVPKAVDYPGSLGLRPFDYHVPMLSLPHLFGTEVETVPWSGAYLRADPTLVRRYRKLLPLGSGKQVGCCWSSGIRDGIWISTYGRRKSMKPSDMLRAINWPYGFVSLQVGPERKDMQGICGCNDILPLEPSWDDTAAVVACLDAVVTVDTAVAHLAGAMGKPVYLAMHQQGSWHWMSERPGASWNERSPWYPSVRVYRQARQDEWDDVMERIAADLRAQSP